MRRWIAPGVLAAGATMLVLTWPFPNVSVEAATSPVATSAATNSNPCTAPHPISASCVWEPGGGASVVDHSYDAPTTPVDGTIRLKPLRPSLLFHSTPPAPGTP
ncbi:MAG: hypothetical protein JWM18_1107 [Chloroflexi bacterium]|jgi:hypothetical protein|nr:hypothetical protein [Chloroflexota bacterium]